MRKLFSLMLLCAAMSLSFTSCSDDDEDDVVMETEYHVSVYVNFLVAYVDRVIVVEYDSNEIEVANHVIECPYGSGTGRYVANSKATKVRAFINGKQVGTTLFLKIGYSWSNNKLSITEDDL